MKVYFDKDVLKILVESVTIKSGLDRRKDEFISWNTLPTFKGNWESIQTWKVNKTYITLRYDNARLQRFVNLIET